MSSGIWHAVRRMSRVAAGRVSKFLRDLRPGGQSAAQLVEALFAFGNAAVSKGAHTNR